MCGIKEYDDLGFCSFGNFNKALLAKQGWRLLKRPDSLVAQVLKAKYHPSSDFLRSKFSTGASYIWS